MRKFSSYGPINPSQHYYVPRQALVAQAVTSLAGEDPRSGGHYFTIWAPRQAGKTWVMIETLHCLRADPYAEQFDVLMIPLEHLKRESDVDQVVQNIAQEIVKTLQLPPIRVDNVKEFYTLFEKGVLKKPLILILDEFDALAADAISTIVGIFRNIHNRRLAQGDIPTGQKDYLLHGVALIGVRAVLGVENESGSPFNVQRSLHIPNLTADEVTQMFRWYEQESGQQIEATVVERLLYETQGQPGLIGWFGELLTETYNKNNASITMHDMDIVFSEALNALPNNTVLNIISKAKQPKSKPLVLTMFQASEKLPFRYDDPQTNFLYLNGVVDREVIEGTTQYLKFANPFIQKRLFNYFAHELFPYLGRLHDPFDDLADTVTDELLHIKSLLHRYEAYLHENRAWLLKDAPRRADLRYFEAVFHFNLYLYLMNFLQRRGGQVHPEFPTGNGQIDLIIQYAGQVYGLELKSYTDQSGYHEARIQAARYGQRLQLAEIWLVFFVETIDEANQRKFETTYIDQATGVTVHPIFVQIGAIDQ